MLAIILAIFLLTNPQLSKNKYVSSDFKLEKGKHNEFALIVADLEFDKEIYENYIAQINKVENDEIKKLLREIVEDEEKHKDILMDIVMRLC